MKSSISQSASYSPDQIVQLGERIYADEVSTLEARFPGEFAVIDVERKEYIVDPDKLSGLERAKAKFGKKLFYIVQIGSLRPLMNYRRLDHAF